MGVTAGKRLYSIDERLRMAIGSMIIGTIGGDSKIGMPVEQTVRAPLVSGAGVFTMYGDGIGHPDPESETLSLSWGTVVNTTSSVEAHAGSPILAAKILTAGDYLIEAHIELTAHSVTVVNLGHYPVAGSPWDGGATPGGYIDLDQNSDPNFSDPAETFVMDMWPGKYGGPWYFYETPTPIPVPADSWVGITVDGTSYFDLIDPLMVNETASYLRITPQQ